MISENRWERLQHVIPRWMGYAKTLREGEFGKVLTVSTGKSGLPPHLELELIKFREDPHPRIAAYLFERLLLLDFREAAKEVARYVVTTKTLQPAVRTVAERLLGETSPVEDLSVEFKVAARIHKSYLRRNPRNGIRWVELARCYTVLRQFEKARDAIKIALALNPHDRYTVRSAIRFFVHVDEPKNAASILSSDLRMVDDPWLLSAGLSALMMAEKSPRKKIIIDPTRFAKERVFDWSEFLSAVGMMAVRDGKGSAKNFFRTAWKDPSGNVTTHAEWVTRTLFPGLRKEGVGFDRSTPEARARIAFSQARWSDMYDSIEEWKLEEPYSRRPYRFGAYASNLLWRHAKALKFVAAIEELGGPVDFGLSISKIYAALCLARLSEAEAELRILEPFIQSTGERVLFTANFGLLQVLLGNFQQGLELYEKAEKLGAEISDTLKAKVFINCMVAKKWAGMVLSDKERYRLHDYENVYADIDSILLFDAIRNPDRIPDEIKKIQGRLRSSLPEGNRQGVVP